MIERYSTPSSVPLLPAASSSLLLLLSTILILSSSRTVSAASSVICPIAGETNVTTITDTFDPVARYSEISGLALSKEQVSDLGHPILFGVSDIGGGARLGIWDSGTGERLLSLNIPEPNNGTSIEREMADGFISMGAYSFITSPLSHLSNPWFTSQCVHYYCISLSIDWEAMAIGTCGNTMEGSCLYIADTGDNLARTSKGEKTERMMPYRIIKMQEPDWKMYSDNMVIPASTIEVLEFDYLDPSSPTLVADSEAMFMDHTGWGEGKSIGDIYVVTKWDNRFTLTNNRIFYIPLSAWDNLDVTYSPAAIGGGNVVLGRRWTRADMGIDGTLIALGDVNATSLFTRCPGVSVEESLLQATPCHTWNNPVEGQMETFTWTFDMSRNLQIAEGTRQPMQWTTMIYDAANAVTCPEINVGAPITPNPTGSPVTPIPTVGNATEAPMMVVTLPPSPAPSTADPTMGVTLPPSAAPLTADPTMSPQLSPSPTVSFAPSGSLMPVPPSRTTAAPYTTNSPVVEDGGANITSEASTPSPTDATRHFGHDEPPGAKCRQ